MQSLPRSATVIPASALFFMTFYACAQEQVFSRAALPFPDNLADIAAFGSRSERRILESDSATANVGEPFSGSLTSEDAQGASVSLTHKVFIESLCGFDDSQDVELYDGQLGPSIEFVDMHQPSTMQIQWNVNLQEKYQPPDADPGNVSGARWCTATLLSGNIAITASHCFDQTGNGWVRPRLVRDGSWQIISPEEIAKNMHVNFNYQRSREDFQIRKPDVFPVVDLLEYHSDLNRPGPLDFAFIRIGQNADGRLPGDIYPSRELGKLDISVGEQITMLQHPDGRPKKVEAGNADNFDNGLLQYGDLDTQGGSSGASVLNNQGEIIGIHIQGGCTTFSGFNKAVPISSVLQFSEFLASQQ